MGDVNTIASTYRIAFTPAGGERLLLLDVGNDVNALPELPLEPKVQTHELINRSYVKHSSCGNAEPHLVFDVYCRCMSMREAQAAPLRLWRQLAAGADGTIHLQTAFGGEKSLPAINWDMPATLAAFRHKYLTMEESPFSLPDCVHYEFEFMVTEPQDAQ